MSQWIDRMVDLLIRYGALGLFIVSFSESSFFPIPPDLILIPLSIINHRLAMFYAALTTLSSILGGMFGYYIGAKAGRPIIERFFSKEKIQKVKGYFDKYGGWAVSIAGLTPIPYKLFTIASGVFRIRKSVFINASIIGRGIRFFTEALIIYIMGDRAQEIIREYFDVLTIGIVLIAVILYFAYVYLKKKSIKDSNKKTKIINKKNIKKRAQLLYIKIYNSFGKSAFIGISLFIIFITFALIFMESLGREVFIFYFYILSIILIIVYLIYWSSYR